MKCSSYGLIKEKKKITLSQSTLWDSKPEREEHLFSTQLISQKRNPTTEINYFEGSGPEWLVPKGNPFLCFWQRVGFWKREREITYWCMPAELTLFFSFLFFLCFFRFFSYLSFFVLSFFLVTPCFHFLVFKFSILSSSSPSLLSLYTARASFYSACRDWILLF